MATNIQNKILKIAERGVQSYYRDKKLNSNLHVLDLNLSTIVSANTSTKYSAEVITKEYHELIKVLENSSITRNYTLSQALSVLRDKSSSRQAVFLIKDPKFGTFLVGKSYNSLSSKITELIKGHEDLQEVFGTSSENSSGNQIRDIRIGHIQATNNISNARTPVGEKLKDILKVVPAKSPLSSQINEMIDSLEAVHKIEAGYSFQRGNINTQALSNVLGSLTVLVTLHTDEKNSSLAPYEAEISSRLNDLLLSKTITDELINTRGSNTILEDITEALADTLRNGRATLKRHSNPKKSKRSLNTSKKGINDTQTSTLKFNIRDQRGQFFSLTNLQSLINNELYERVAANMEDPALVFRTGRFARSVEVTRMSISRQGMLTVFYTYMKYPYQTFEPGYKQGSISRDPRKLISKSIREVATTLVTNRLRAVRV